ncbi:MAG: PAS domain-containing sensor histidine kinase [Candidatus Dormibacteria bacterium]
MSTGNAQFSALIRAFFQSDEGVQFFLEAVEQMPMALMLFRVEGTEHRLVYLNRSAMPTDQVAPPDLVGRVASRAFRAQGADLSKILDVVRDGREPVHVSEYRSGDGRVWEGDVQPIVGRDGAVNHIVMMATDVSSAVRQRADDRVEAAQANATLSAQATRLAELDKIKSDFLNLASHELRGPLAVLRGYISMLGDGSLGELPPSAAAVMPALDAKAAHMALLITQMLEAARLEDSRLHLKIETVDLRQLARAAVAAMAALARPKQSVMFQGGSAPLLVLGDRLRLENILLNLLDNALKYSPGGGEVRMIAGRRHGNAVITVRDNGIGIAEADMPKLFTRFGRLVTDENSHIPGTGLGLYLCRELARMHGGEITATSEAGRGSEFVLRVPLKQT